MKLYLIRHGETDWNKEFKIQGSSDIELNEYGRELAFITRSFLEAGIFRYMKINGFKKRVLDRLRVQR